MPTMTIDPYDIRAAIKAVEPVLKRSQKRHGEGSPLRKLRIRCLRGGTLELCATDGVRVHLVTVPAHFTELHHDLAEVPRLITLGEVERWKGEAAAVIAEGQQRDHDHRDAELDLGSWEPADGFPPIERVIPAEAEEAALPAVFSPADLALTIRCAGAIGFDVRLQINPEHGGPARITAESRNGNRTFTAAILPIVDPEVEEPATTTPDVDPETEARGNQWRGDD